MYGWNWFWIAVMAMCPPIVAVLVAYPLWQRSEAIFGNLAGTAVIFGTAFALILREAAELDRLARRCLDAGFICHPDPSAFARYAVYASIGLVEVVALFSWSLKVEQRLRDRDYAPEWRSR